MHVSYKALGEIFSAAYGSDATSIDAAIRGSADEQLMLCLLCAITARLRRISEYMEAAEMKTASSQPSDGMLQALEWQYPAEIHPLRIADLSIRAKKAIRRGEFRRVQDITEKKLRTLMNCGPATIKEVIQWRDRELAKEGHGATNTP